jgi:hypothetical protein
VRRDVSPDARVAVARPRALELVDYQVALEIDPDHAATRTAFERAAQRLPPTSGD